MSGIRPFRGYLRPPSDENISPGLGEWLDNVTSIINAMNAGNITPLPAPTVSAQGQSNAVYLTWNEIPGAASYKIFTNTSASLPGAPLTTVPAASFSGSNGHVVSGLRSATPMYYAVQPVSSNGTAGALSQWVSAAPATTQAHSTNLVQNPSFAQYSQGQPVATWWTNNFETAGNGVQAFIAQSPTFDAPVSQAISGNSSSNGGAIASQAFPVTAGQNYQVSAMVQSTVANSGSIYIRILWYNSTFGPFTQNSSALVSSNDVISSGSCNAANTWTHFSRAFNAPAGAVMAVVALFNWVGTSTTLYFAQVNVSPNYVSSQFPGASVSPDGTITNADGAVSTKVYTVPAGSAFQISMVANKGASTDSLGFNFGALPNGNHYTIKWQSDNNFVLYKVISGTATALASKSYSTSDTNVHTVTATIKTGTSNSIACNIDGQALILSIDGSLSLASIQVSLITGAQGIVHSFSAGPLGIGSHSIVGQGSIANAIHTDTFSYASTSSSITWSWGTHVVQNTTGIGFTISAGSAPTFSGLSSSTTYYFQIYYNITNQTVQVAMSQTNGGKSPDAAGIYYQYETDSLAIARLNSSAATTSSGSGGGSGGGSGFCFSPNTKVKTRRGPVPIADVEVGDEVLTARGTWRRVQAVTCRDYEGRALNMGDDEIVTPEHLFLAGDWKRADALRVFQSSHYAGTIHNLHLDTEPDDDGSAPDTEHSYTLANGWVAHNVIT